MDHHTWKYPAIFASKSTVCADFPNISYKISAQFWTVRYNIMLHLTEFDKFVVISNWEYAVVYYWFLTESVKNQVKTLIYGFCAFFSIVLLVFGITRISVWRMQRMRWFGWKSWIRRGRRLKNLMGMNLWIEECLGWGE